MKDQLLGNGLRQEFCYNNNTLRLTGLRVYSGALAGCLTAPSSPILNLSYSYQNNGNVSQIVDATRNETLTYTYDELDRLLSVSGPYSNTYTYNNIGNLTGATFLPKAAAAGEHHTCVVTPGGGAMCWGKNSSGQLGDGTTTQRDAPVEVSGLTSGVTSIAAGASHTCALLTTGGVKCWGYNSSGQLGDNSTTQRTTPVDVSGLTSGVSAVVTGDYFTCALTTSGGVKCWGNNSNGQLGNNSTANSDVPVDVSGLTSGVIGLTTGGSHACALLTSGGLKCWGRNSNGQLGDGTTAQRLTPVDVSGLTSGVSFVDAGYRQTCAKTSSGGAKCWGQNTNGQLGDGTTTQRTTPVDVSGLTSGVVGLRTGGYHTCARLTSGALKCWGLNDDGQLGDGTTTQRLTPVDVSGITANATSMAMGRYHSCVRVTGGGLQCWGSNSHGQLSDDTVTHSTTPLVIGITGYTYTYSTTHKHAATALSSGESYSYDANGNMITRVEGGLTYTQTFDAENRLISVTVSGQTTQFVYNGDGNLAKKINPDGSKTIYVGGIYEVDKTSGGTVIGTKTYYPAAGAMRVGSTLYYVLKDHLGSASVVTNNTGTIVTGADTRYYPFGEARFSTSSMLTDKLFTGQREMAGLGIYHYQARFYSPKLGRFLSADTIVPGYANPQNLNRYSYVINNPLLYTDPTGHMFDDGCRVNCGGGGSGGGGDYCTTHPWACGSGGGGGGGSSEEEDNPVINIINPTESGVPYISTGGLTLYAMCQNAGNIGTNYYDGCSTETAYSLSWFDSYQLEEALHVLSTPGYSPIGDAIEELVMSALPFGVPPVGMLVQGVQATFNNNYDALYSATHSTNAGLISSNPDINQPVNIHVATGLWTSPDPDNTSQPGYTWVYISGQGHTGSAVGIPGGMTNNIQNLLLEIISP